MRKIGGFDSAQPPIFEYLYFLTCSNISIFSVAERIGLPKQSNFRWLGIVEFSVTERSRSLRKFSKLRQIKNLTTFHGRLMCQDSNRCPVGRLHGIREWVTVFDKCRNKFMSQMWMRATVSATLCKT